MLVPKVKKSLAKLPSFKKIVVAVSGGPDSVALAYALKGLGYEVIIAHLNHQLRGAESDGDEQFIRNLTKQWGAPCVVQKSDIPKTGNLENNARQIRYAFLEKARKAYGAKYIAIAHHFDDQIETVLMHAARGAGLRGLCGMPLQNDAIIRPLLDIGRKDILDFLKKHRLAYRTDSSNLDLKFTRNYWRHLVIPHLKDKISDFEGFMKLKMAEAGKKLAILSAKAEKWVTEHVKNGRFDRREFSKLDTDLQAEIIIRLVGAYDLYDKHIKNLADFIGNGQTGKTMAVKSHLFTVEYDKVLIHKPMVEKPEGRKVRLTPKGVSWEGWKIKVTGIIPLYVRSWRAGDRFQPKGLQGTKKLQDFFTDQKIPRRLRHKIPIVVNKDDRIVSVGNLRYDQSAKDIFKSLKITPKK